jgi:hypothetical protein
LCRIRLASESSAAGQRGCEAERGPHVGELTSCDRLGTIGSSQPTWACGAAGSAPEWHSGGHRFDPGQVHHPFIPTLNRLQVAESRRGYGGSNKAVSVERNPFRKEQLLTAGTGRATPARRGRRRAGERVLRRPGCLPRRVHRAARSGPRDPNERELLAAFLGVGGRRCRCRSSARRGTLRRDGRAFQRIGKHGPILCSDLRRVAKLVSETEESIVDTGFRVTSRLHEPNEPHRCLVVVALSSCVRLPRCRRPTQQSHSGSPAPGSGIPRPATIGHQAPQRSREGLK